jgi:ADP-heptose:LPS heptosyltransferase
MPVDWKNVRRVLLIRLRSIGDTVLATPSLIALKRFAPDVRVDILLEDWVAPVLDDFDYVDNVVIVGKSPVSRLSTALALRRTGYDVVLNLHGGTTATFFAFATGAPHRIGYSHYQYKFLFNHVLSSSADFWGRPVTHSAEQQMAMLGFAGVPVAESIKSRLVVSERT